MAEELAFEQLPGYGRAVHLDQRSVGAWARVVDRRRDELLADAALAEDEHARVRSRHDARFLEHLLHRLALGDDLSMVKSLAHLAP